MNGLRYWGGCLAALYVLLGACVTTPVPAQREGLAPTPMVSWEEVRGDPACVIPACDEARCTLWRCQTLEEVSAAPVVLARGTVGFRPPPMAHPGRWWGRTLAAPTGVEPVFEIPWHHWNTRGQFARKARPLSCLPPPEPLEKHHIFPQQPELVNWFKLKQIDIHAYTIPLPRSFHAVLHSGGPQGGQWNQAWREFRKENIGATQEEIWQFAFTLMSRFGVNAQFVPYYCR
jgi:uncharacterized lipoprotein (TIGR02269 family)